MELSTIKWKRNGLFLHLFGFAIFFHVLIYLLTGNSLHMFSLAFGLSAYIGLVILQHKGNSVGFSQTAILLLINLTVFILNIETLAPINAIYFVFPLIISALYYETWTTLGIGIITAMEFLLLIFLFDGFIERAPLAYMNLQLTIFILLTLCLTVVHSVFFRRFLMQIEEKNSSMEKALNSKEGYLHLFFETAKDAIAVFDADDKIIAINPAFEELYGWTSAESIGQSLPMIPPERLEAAIIRSQEVRSGKSYSLLETQDLKKDGSRFEAQITLSPIVDQNGNVIATSVISRDISYRKEAEKLIIQSEKLKLAGGIAAGVAHEIRNPMTVISGFIQMMGNDVTYPYKNYIKLIQSEIERINLIISEFLILSKPQATKRKKIVLKKIVEDIALLFGPQLNLQNILFSSHFEQENFMVEGEEHHLKQVFINLMKNAVEALEGVERQGEIKMAIKSHGDHFVSFSISDNGNGIPEESASLIFEPFYTTKTNGTGLGLLISQKIIQEHGATLVIHSNEGNGTTATITFPLI